jgi:hypothetical protein
MLGYEEEGVLNAMLKSLEILEFRLPSVFGFILRGSGTSGTLTAPGHVLLAHAKGVKGEVSGDASGALEHCLHGGETSAHLEETAPKEDLAHRALFDGHVVDLEDVLYTTFKGSGFWQPIRTCPVMSSVQL